MTRTSIQSLEANLSEHMNSHITCYGDRGAGKRVVMLLVVIVHAIGKWIEDAPWWKTELVSQMEKGAIAKGPAARPVWHATIAQRWHEENWKFKVWSMVYRFYTFRMSSRDVMVVRLGKKVKMGQDILSDKHFYRP
jgi:hypothetical protein